MINGFVGCNSKAQEVPKRKVVVHLPDIDRMDVQLLFNRLKGVNVSDRGWWIHSN